MGSGNMLSNHRISFPGHTRYQKTSHDLAQSNCGTFLSTEGDWNLAHPKTKQYDKAYCFFSVPMQSTSSSHYSQESNQSTGGFRSHGSPPSFTMPFNTNALPTDIASMLMNMASNMPQAQPSQSRQGEDSNVSGSDEPGIRIGGNINLNFGENMPEDITGALRSMMEMFSGPSPQGNPNPHDTDTTNGRSATH